ncbi:hypothetical protein D9V37_10485 [Nocardioides mangrovicus]|uniref:DUF2530 domain-containing protein n=1 Tax=Nocardioides mangrovicus TaxID=2478913 RepID=A0A3L8P235_9ACTN|nr:hypothetical protein D9V37_10485 [Nocardioides mangrovicus]
MARNAYVAPASKRAGFVAVLLWVLAVGWVQLVGAAMGTDEIVIELALIVGAIWATLRAWRLRRG